MCQNFNASTFLVETSKSPENTCPHQQDDSSLPLKTRQEHPAQHLWQIFYYIYLLKDINKWKGLWFKPGNSAFIAEAIRRLFLGSHHSPSANFAMQKSPLRGAKDPSTGGWAAISPRMLSIRFSSLVPAEMRKTKCEHLFANRHASQESRETSGLRDSIWLHVWKPRIILMEWLND